MCGRTDAPSAAVVVRTGFPGLKAVARPGGGQAGPNPGSAFSSSPARPTPERLIDVARSHWASENSLHRVLDTVFAEDNAGVRKDNAPQDLATITRLALNIARLHPDRTTPIRRKLLRAAWHETFFFELIRHMR